MSNLPVLVQSARVAVDLPMDEGVLKKGFKWVFGKLRKIAAKHDARRKAASASRAPAGKAKRKAPSATPKPRPRVSAAPTAKRKTTKPAAKKKTTKKAAAKRLSKAEFAKKRAEYMKKKPWEKKTAPKKKASKKTAKKRGKSELQKELGAAKGESEKRKAHKERMAASKKRIAALKQGARELRKVSKSLKKTRAGAEKVTAAAKKVRKKAKKEDTTMSMRALIEGTRRSIDLSENALKAFGTTEQELFDYLKGPNSKRVSVSELVYAFGGEPTSWAKALKKLVDAGKLGKTFNKRSKTYVYHLPVGGKASPEIKNAIKKWVDKWNSIAKKTDYYLNVGVDYRRTNILIFTIDKSGNRSALYFVDSATGDLLRPDGWKKPSKNVHGSIFKTDPADILKMRGAYLKKKPPEPTPTPVNKQQQPVKAPVGSPPKQKVPHLRLIKGGRWGESIQRLRELLGEASVKKAAVPMDAEGFIAEVKKQARIKDRQLRIGHGALSSIRKNQLFINFINLPQGLGNAGGGAEAENNRWMCSVNGFDKDGGPPPSGKVKMEIHISYGFPKMRGKTGTPQQVAKAIAAQLTKIVKEVEPNYTHTKREDLEESMQLKRWYKLELRTGSIYYFYAVDTLKSGGVVGMQVETDYGKARGKAAKSTVSRMDMSHWKPVEEKDVPARVKQKVEDRIGDVTFAPKEKVSKPSGGATPTGPLSDKERAALKVILGYKAFARAKYMEKQAPGVEYKHDDPTIRGLEARGLLKISGTGSIQAIRAKAEKAMGENMEEAAKPVGKVQTAVLAYVKKNASKAEPLELTSIARIPELRGVHFGKIQKAVEVLIKKGLLKSATGPESGKETAVEGSDDMKIEGCGKKLHKLAKKSKKKEETEPVDFTSTNVSLDRIRVELEDKVLAAEGVDLDEVKVDKQGSGDWVVYFETEKPKTLHRWHRKSKKEAIDTAKEQQKKSGGYVSVMKGGIDVAEVGPGGKVKAEDTDLDEAKKKKSMEPGGGGRFAAMVQKLKKRGDVSDPKAVAAAIGRKKYGAKKMAQMAAKGRARARGG